MAKLAVGRSRWVRVIDTTVVALAIGFGILSAQQGLGQSLQPGPTSRPSFEVTSVKPDRTQSGNSMVHTSPTRFTATNVTVKFLIEYAFNIRDFQLSGGPSWIGSDKYDIDAKIEDSLSDTIQKLPPDQRPAQTRLMLQSLLADRFQLQVSHAKKDLPIYALIISKGGPKLTQAGDVTHEVSGNSVSDAPRTPATGGAGGVAPGTFQPGGAQLNMTGASVSARATALSGQSDVGRVVLDETGLTGRYDIKLQWTHESQALCAGPSPASSGATIFTAIQEQLGLKLESRKGPVATVVIIGIEKPSAN